MRALLLLLTLLVSPSFAAESVEDLVLAGRYADAAPLAEAQAVAAPEDLDKQERYIGVMRALGMAAAVDPIYAGLAPAASSDADAHYLRGLAGATPDRMEDGLRAALKLDPGHARALTALGHLQRARGDLAAAEASYRTALSANDTLADAWSGLGAVLMVQNKLDAALEVGRRAIKKVPARGDNYVAVATLDPKHAGETLEKGVAAAPTDPRLRAALARHYLTLGKGKEAQRAARAALEINPLDPDARRWMMYAKAQQDGVLDASGFNLAEEAREGGRVEAWSTLIAGYPKCALLWVERSAAHAARNDLKGARADAEKALSIDPDNIEAHAALGLILLDPDPAAAKPHLKAAVEGRAVDASLQVATAIAEAQTGEMDAARARLKDAVETHPYDLRALLTYGQVLSAEDAQATYDLMADAVQRMPDARVVLAFVGAAKDAGRLKDAAKLLEDVGRRTGNPVFKEAATMLEQHQ
ncbi:MAG: tetratricopeptide repeat protein [Deltaproteobacteria bacterium]|nr:MAG: tetratricopeptide repeat protein [Deltaproteobacteria bacterium]